MNNYIIILILAFSHTICSDLTNITYDDSYPVCPVRLFRRKRAPTEYTRWIANQGTTQEFLVKVLDEDLSTPAVKQVVAVNIQPITKGGEKIIVGGVIIPPVTTPQIIPENSFDYTRFVPPTTLPVTNIDDELFLAPQIQPKNLDKIPPIKPKVQYAAPRNSMRDESPPASPQFLSRTPALLARQYAPITPVAFSQRTTFTPRKPTVTPNIFESPELLPPTRTPEIPEIDIPKRTQIDDTDLKDIPESTDDSINDIVTRSTSLSIDKLYRTSTMKIAPEESVPTSTGRNYEGRKFEQSIHNSILQKNFGKSFEKDIDNSYNMMFYGDEDAETTNKKHDTADMYDEKVKINFDFDSSTEKDIDVIDVDNKQITVEEFTTNATTSSPFSMLAFGSNGQTPTPSPVKSFNRDLPRPICNLEKLRQSNLLYLRTLPEIVLQLRQWADNSPLVKWEDITAGNLTTMENPIYLMIVDDPSSGQILSAKQTVMIVAGIQGRDHHAVAAAMYVLYQLIERSESHSDLLTKYRFWVIPVFNPDGYDYSMTFPHRNEWTKNLRQHWETCKNKESCKSCELYGIRCTVQPCYGVNLDRNFEYQWIPTEELRAEHPCGSLHAGARQLSEAETQALTHFLHEKRTPLYTFIAFKEGEVLGVMYPYSHTRKLRAFDHVYRQRASRAASAAYSISGRPYVAGQTSEFLPLYAGGIEDWVDGHLGIDNTYTIMMFRPTDSYNSKLVTERIVHEAYAAMDTLLLQSVEPLGPPQVTLRRSNGSSIHRAPLCLVILISITHFLHKLTNYS